MDEVPREVLLDQAEPEQVAQPGQHVLRARVGDRFTASVNASHCSSSPWARAASISSDWFALKSAAASVARELGCRTQAARDIGHHLLHAAGEQLVLLICAQPALDRAGGRAEVADGLAELTQARAVEDLAGGLTDGELGEGRSIRALELLGVVGEQALADQLQEHVVVALERDVDIEVGAQADEAVLGEEARAAARLARLLERVECVPGRQGLERGREGLEVFAVVVGVGLAAEDGVELLQELVVREDRRVGRARAAAAVGAGACRSPAARPRRCPRPSRTGGAGCRR